MPASLFRLKGRSACKSWISCAAIASIVALGAFPAEAAIACEGAENVRLSQTVRIDPALRAELRNAPPLRVVAVDAPPMARYDATRQTYVGIAVDILCFITTDLGMSFEIAAGRDETVVDKLRQVQAGQADIFIPLSHSSTRAEKGLFTADFYSSYYAVIARHGSKVIVSSIRDLPAYRVGYIQGVSFEPLLQSIVPPAKLSAFNETTSDGLFDAVQNGTLDLAVFNRDIFTEKRYRGEFFDLETIHTLYEHPRAYRYYFSDSPAHARLIDVFDQYLGAIDISASVIEHQDGERRLLERYIAQRSQRTLLMFTSFTAILLVTLMSLALLRHRRLTRLLKERNAYIELQREALYEANQKLETLSRTDSLTGLSNRRYFDERVAEEYKRHQRNGSPLSLLIIDVDLFKNVNDDYGHVTGDMYLRTIAKVLERCVGRSTDVVARYGGEEFTCLLTDTSAENAVAIAERIRHETERLHLPNSTASPPWVTASVGVATVTGGDPGVKALFIQADTQLYIAKQRGRNQVCSEVLSE